jgi:hypothetical protein
MPKITEGANQVDGIPVRWAAAGAPVGLALWLTHLGGSGRADAADADPTGRPRSAGGQLGSVATILTKDARRWWAALTAHAALSNKSARKAAWPRIS